MNRFERFFITSILIYSIAILVFAMVLYRWSDAFRSSMEEIADKVGQPYKMEIIYKEED